MNRRFFIGAAAAICAKPLSAETRILNPCLPARHADFRDQARASWPVVMRNGFSEFGIGVSGLTVKIIPKNTPRRFSNCPKAAILDQLRLSPDGRPNGNIAQPSHEVPLQSDSRRMFFDVDDLEDWSYLMPGARQMFGAYQLRRDLSLAMDGGAIMMQLQPHPLPHGWN